MEPDREFGSYLTVREAAEAVGCSQDTIKRRLRAGSFPGMVKGHPRGRRSPPWLIPVRDLVAAQLIPTVLRSVEHPVTESLDLRTAVAEAIVIAQQRHITDLTRQLESLTALVASLAHATTVDEQERARIRGALDGGGLQHG